MAINANKHELARNAWRDGAAKNAEVGSKMATNRVGERERGAVVGELGGWTDEKNGDITRLAAKRRIKQAVMIAGML